MQIITVAVLLCACQRPDRLASKHYLFAVLCAEKQLLNPASNSSV